MNNNKLNILYVIHIDWNWIKQRPQFLAESLNVYYNVNVLYIKPLRDLFKAKKNISLYVSPIDTDSLLQNEEFIDYMDKNFNFKGTRQDKNVLEVFEKYLINKYNFKSDISWNARLEEITLYNRMKKLAGIK